MIVQKHNVSLTLTLKTGARSDTQHGTEIAIWTCAPRAKISKRISVNIQESLEKLFTPPAPPVLLRAFEMSMIVTIPKPNKPQNKAIHDTFSISYKLLQVCFQIQQKTAAVFVNMTAAYDTAWKEELLCKLAAQISCYTTQRLINNMLSDRHFQVIHKFNKKTEKWLATRISPG